MSGARLHTDVRTMLFGMRQVGLRWVQLRLDVALEVELENREDDIGVRKMTDVASKGQDVCRYCREDDEP